MPLFKIGRDNLQGAQCKDKKHMLKIKIPYKGTPSFFIDILSPEK